MRNERSMTGCEAPKGRYGLKTHLLTYIYVFMPYLAGELVADDYPERDLLTGGGSSSCR
ncbi:MAG: hypothetical protein NTZ19_01665 [Bacteroidetes bacterium]|nr:hypothetical protein [Bacteroidota bacterium]